MRQHECGPVGTGQVGSSLGWLQLSLGVKGAAREHGWNEAAPALPLMPEQGDSLCAWESDQKAWAEGSFSATPGTPGGEGRLPTRSVPLPQAPTPPPCTPSCSGLQSQEGGLAPESLLQSIWTGEHREPGHRGAVCGRVVRTRTPWGCCLFPRDDGDMVGEETTQKLRPRHGA